MPEAVELLTRSGEYPVIELFDLSFDLLKHMRSSKLYQHYCTVFQQAANKYYWQQNKPGRRDKTKEKNLSPCAFSNRQEPEIDKS